MQIIPENIDRKKYCTFYIVRHGQTEWNVKRIIQGRYDSPLTKIGLNQIDVLAQELKELKFDAAFSSDLLRAKRTAEIIALEHNLAVETTKHLRERDFGIFDGKPTDLIRSHEKLIDKLSDEERKTRKPWEGFESDEEVIGRIFTFLRETAVAFSSKKVLVVTHSVVIRVILIHLGFATYKTLPPGTVENTAYIKLLSDGVDFFIDETKGIHPLQ